MRKRILTWFFVFLLCLLPYWATAEFENKLYELLIRDEKPVGVQLQGFQAVLIQQFDEKRTEQLNRLIAHLSLMLSTDGDLSEVTLLADNQPALTMTSNTQDGKDSVRFSFDRTHIYTGITDQMSVKEQENTAAALFINRTFIPINRILDELYLCFEKLPVIYPELVKTQNTKLHYNGFGIAVKRINMILPAEQTEDTGFINKICGENTTEVSKEFSGATIKGVYKISLYYDETDRLIRITCDGQAGYTPEDLRRVSINWKCIRDSNETKDDFVLKTPAVHGSERYNMTITRELACDGNGNDIMRWGIQTDRNQNREKSLVTFSADLKQEDGKVSGEVIHQTKKNQDERKVVVIPELNETKSRGEYNGTLEIVDYSGKIEKNRIRLEATIKEGNSIAWESLPANESADENKDGKESESILAQKMIRQCLKAILKLPDEDLVYISDGIDMQEWAKILALTSGIGD